MNSNEATQPELNQIDETKVKIQQDLAPRKRDYSQLQNYVDCINVCRYDRFI